MCRGYIPIVCAWLADSFARFVIIFHYTLYPFQFWHYGQDHQNHHHSNHPHHHHRQEQNNTRKQALLTETGHLLCFNGDWNVIHDLHSKLNFKMSIQNHITFPSNAYVFLRLSNNLELNFSLSINIIFWEKGKVLQTQGVPGDSLQRFNSCRYEMDSGWIYWNPHCFPSHPSSGNSSE